jgi:hypothetical protein
MNKKQLISMWCGIAAITLAGLYRVGHLTDTQSLEIRDYNVLLDFILCVFLISLVTGGLILTFKDEKGKESKDDSERSHK